MLWLMSSSEKSRCEASPADVERSQGRSIADWLNRAVVRRSLVRWLSLLQNSLEGPMIVCKDIRMTDLLTVPAINASVVFAYHSLTTSSIVSRLEISVDRLPLRDYPSEAVSTRHA